MLRMVILIATFMASTTATAACDEFLDHSMRKLHSSDSVNLCELIDGRPVLIVNTASHCGFTPQFTGLEALHQRYNDEGLVVIGFASNDFRQAAKSEEEAATICYKNHGVTFTMLAPSHVKGNSANPVFNELARQARAPSWNFNKYLLDASGKVVQHFDSSTRPDDPLLKQAIENVL